MTEVGTLKKLNVKPGDVVECVDHWYQSDPYNIGGKYTVSDNGKVHGKSGIQGATGKCALWRVVSRVSEDTPKLWRDMTDEEKGALLLAAHEGKTIQFLNDFIDDPEWITAKPRWQDCCAYRVKPKPVRETVVLENDRNGGWSFYEDSGTHKNTHHITFDLIDGKPDLDSIKMEEL